MIPQQATRRTFLKATLGASAVGLAASAGLLTPTRVLAAEWPKNAFDAKSIADALKDLYGASASTASGSIKIKAPIQAENGAVVPIAVSANLPNVQGLAVFVEKNAQPLVASVALTGAAGYFSARMKMGQTSDVHVVCKAGGKLYSAKQTIKVTVGGCGG
ncbi:MAG: thiosulfate oxidation carrier protein SoxY [Pseudomonadota bacterium]